MKSSLVVLLLFASLPLSGCGIATKPVTLDAWLLKADREHPEGLRFLPDREADPQGEALADKPVFALEMDGIHRLVDSLPCVPSCCFDGNWLTGAPPGKRVELGRSDGKGHLHVVWAPPSRWHRLALMDGETRDWLLSGSTQGLPDEAYEAGHARVEVRIGSGFVRVLMHAIMPKAVLAMASREIGAEITSVDQLRQLAESGDPKAQYFMGMISHPDVLPGEGSSEEEATLWFRKSASHGYGPAQEALRDLEKPLNP